MATVFLKNPYGTWKKAWPKSLFDRIAFTTFVIGGHLACFYESQIVLPHYHKDAINVTIVFHYVVAAWIYLNCMGNLVLLSLSKLTGPVTQLHEQNPDSKYCEICLLWAPPRSHHCKVCNVCVLRRDHHCWFAGRCIGFNNHRYYIGCLFYAWIAAIYCNIYHYDFTIEVLGGHNLHTIYILLAPHVALILHQISFFEFFVSFLCFAGIFFLLMLTYLTKLQLNQIMRGQTSHEFKTGIHSYNQGWRKNIESVLGSRWYFFWLWPEFPSPICGDGTYFEEKKID